MPKPPIGFCGLGAMGLGMATHLVSRGFFVKGFDVSPAALSSFQKAGGKPAPSLSDSAQDSPLYILMVANQDQAQKALFDANDSIVEALPEGAVLCMCCTVSPMYVKSVGAELLKRNRSDIRLVDCPVSGGAGRAASGDLTIMCGGKAEAVKLASPLLEELTDPGGLFIVEGGLGQGSSMKMCHQVLAVVQILAVGETLGFAAHLGLEAEEITKRVLEGEAWSWMFQNRSPRSIRGQFEHPVSALSIITKDSSIIGATGRQTLFPLPITALAEQIYIAGVHSYGMGTLDDSIVVKMYTNTVVADVRCTMDDAEREAKIQMILEYLIAVHIGAAAEAIMLADHCGIPLKQFFALVLRSAGTSRMFERFAEAMSDDEGAEPVTGRTMQQCVQSLVKAIDEAVTANISLPLANAVLQIYELLRWRIGEEKEASNILRAWE